MKPRKLKLGNKNIIGAKVYDARNAKGLKQKELLEKLQQKGVEISTPALSLLEGQKRPVSDIELKALSEILNVSVQWLLGIQDDK
ncbi:MAG: helix-turn-helix domain-containing protein [Oscillospiraceae bacterium]|nr:helix-turn-helix domain-containing protein [Oscillospiraceae bacterium]